MDKRPLSVVPAGVTGISCSPDGFAVIQGGGKMMTQTDISAASFGKGHTVPDFAPPEKARKQAIKLGDALHISSAELLEGNKCQAIVYPLMKQL